MPIHAFLKERSFEPDIAAAMTRAYECALRTLGIVDRLDPITRHIAEKIVAIVDSGVRDERALYELTIAALRGRQDGAAHAPSRSTRTQAERSLSHGVDAAKVSTMNNPKVDTTDNAVKDPDDWVSGDEPMTGAQASYLKTLSEQMRQPDAFDETLTKAEASKRIDALKAKLAREAPGPIA
jgi:hypothetical protein